MTISKFLKILGLVIGLVGLIFTVLNLTGHFKHPERELMVQQIRKEGRVPSDNPAFAEFVKKFPPPKSWSNNDIEGLAPSTLMKSGGVVTPVGPLIYVGQGKQKTKSIATFQELIEWSQESSYPYLSWIVTAVGWFICASGVILEMSERSDKVKASIKQPAQGSKERDSQS